MCARRAFLGRVAGFSFVPLISILATFLLLPLIAGVGGASGWVAVAVGQSVGSVAALFLVHGWSLTGPTRVAPLGPELALDLYVESVRQRAVLSVLYVPCTVAVTVLLAPRDHVVTAALMGLAALMLGFSPSWFWIGRGTPARLLAYEAVPRTAAILASFPLLALTRELVFYPLVLMLASIGGLALFHVREKIPASVWVPEVTKARLRALRTGIPPAASVSVAGLYTSMSTALVATVAPLAAQAQFTSGDRLYKLGGQAIGVAGNTLQGWVAEPEDPSARTTRIRRALLAHAVIAPVGALLLTLVGPWFTRVYFGDPALAVPTGVMAAYGVAFAALTMNSGVGRMVLMPLDMQRAMLLSTVCGAAVGVPAILVGAAAGGSLGAAAGVAAAEMTVLVVQVGALMVRRRRNRR